MASKKKKLRQAKEENGTVSVLCFACRRASDNSKQQTISASFFSISSTSVAAPSASAADVIDACAGEEPLCCSKCRRVMEKRKPAGGLQGSGKSRVLPQIARIRAYQRVATEQGVAFAISESLAASMMRRPCIACGIAAPTEGHGLTRLRVWPAGLERPARGGFMGPYHPENLATACSFCNLAKGYRRVRGYVEACRHIATHRGCVGDFGRYPRRFRNNVSKRSRSCYISASSTHSKTHSLTNEEFNAIVSQPCRYCGKESDPPRHHNGLDRIDNSVRVYSSETCCSCCGDCNVLKYQHSEEAFIAKCVAVARHNVGIDSFPGDESDDGARSDDGSDDGRAKEGEGEGEGEEYQGADDRFFSKARAKQAKWAARAAAAEAQVEHSHLAEAGVASEGGAGGCEPLEDRKDQAEEADAVPTPRNPTMTAASATSQIMAWDEWEEEDEGDDEGEDEDAEGVPHIEEHIDHAGDDDVANPFAAFAFESADHVRKRRRCR